ncbi:hypothetical protein ACFW04_008815 [Cataglyphis niger]
MSEKSIDSTIEEQEDRHIKRSRIAKCFKALFCCFKRESNAREIVKYDPYEYDYIVEKLVVKRVPLALFVIPADLADRRRCDDAMSDDISPSSSLSAFGGNNFSANAITHKTYPTSTRMNRSVYDSAANKTLRSDINKNQDLSLDDQAKSLIWKQGILNRFNVSLHPDLKEFERSSKNPPNFPRSKLSFAEDISVTSNTKTDISSRSSTSSITVQDDVSTREDFARLGSVLKSERNDKSQAKKKDIEKDRNKFVLGRNRRYIVSPFRIKRDSLDLTKPKNVVGDFGVDGKSLAYIQESVEEKSSELVKNSKDCDLQSNTVRWRITIRRRRANANSEPPSSEEKMHR